MVSFTSLLRTLRPVLASLALLALAACGFHLKGASPMPFQSIYTNINLDSEFGARLRRTILANQPDLIFTDERLEANVYLHRISESKKLRELSLDADGKVEEYELALLFSFELVDRNGHVLLAPTTLHSVRELPYNDRDVQAEESEIGSTFKDMRNSLIDQILRRISSPEVLDAYANVADQPVTDIPDDTPLDDDEQEPDDLQLLTDPGGF